MQTKRAVSVQWEGPGRPGQHRARAAGGRKARGSHSGQLLPAATQAEEGVLVTLGQEPLPNSTPPSLLQSSLHWVQPTGESGEGRSVPAPAPTGDTASAPLGEGSLGGRPGTAQTEWTTPRPGHAASCSELPCGCRESQTHPAPHCWARSAGHVCFETHRLSGLHRHSCQATSGHDICS